MAHMLREFFLKKIHLYDMFHTKKDACLHKRLVVLLLYTHYTAFHTIK